MGKIILGVILLVLWLWIGPPITPWDWLASQPLAQTEQSAEVDVATADGQQVSDFKMDWQRVARVIDGDTFDLVDGERVRLLGIDTPEEGECYSQEATDYLRDLVEGKMVRLEKDVSDRDKYNRLLRQVYVNNKDNEISINLQLVTGGYAGVVVVLPDQAHREIFKKAEAKAKEAKVGRWGACE